MTFLGAAVLDLLLRASPGTLCEMSVLTRMTRVVSGATHTPATRRYAHDSFAALNILKDPAGAPVEKVCRCISCHGNKHRAREQDYGCYSRRLRLPFLSKPILTI